MKDVIEHKIIDLPISKIQIDLDNPNKMSQTQFEALKKVMTKFGYLAPIIVDKDYKIADGEHRYLVYTEFGKKTIPAYVLDIGDVDRRMLRQVMNKLRGEHEFELDIKEFEIFKKSNKIDELKDLLPNINFLHELIIKEKEYDENIETTNKCPKCGYLW